MSEEGQRVAVLVFERRASLFQLPEKLMLFSLDFHQGLSPAGLIRIP